MLVVKISVFHDCVLCRPFTLNSLLTCHSCRAMTMMKMVMVAWWSARNARCLWEKLGTACEKLAYHSHRSSTQLVAQISSCRCPAPLPPHPRTSLQHLHRQARYACTTRHMHSVMLHCLSLRGDHIMCVCCLCAEGEAGARHGGGDRQQEGPLGSDLPDCAAHRLPGEC